MYKLEQAYAVYQTEINAALDDIAEMAKVEAEIHGSKFDRFSFHCEQESIAYKKIVARITQEFDITEEEFDDQLDREWDKMVMVKQSRNL